MGSLFYPDRVWEDTRMKKTLTAIAFALAAMATAAPALADGERIVMVSHGGDSDSWWNVIKNALAEGGKQMGVTTEYRNPASGDIADMARIIEQTTAANPDGIIVTIADYDVLKGPIKAAVDKGIPVITINSGTLEQSKEMGALMHVGQPEYDAGHGAGLRAKAQGVKNFVCVNHLITNPASVERCRGYADAIGVELGSQMIDTGLDPSEVLNKVSAYLKANPDTQAILAIGPNSAIPTIKAVEAAGLAGEIRFSTFDLSPEIAQAIKDGTIDFAIDQQPYLQGQLPVVFLTNYIRYGVIPGNSVNSGPGFITKDNIAQVEELAGKYR